VAVTRFGNKSFDFTYRIIAGDGRLIATAKTVQVAYDYQADRPMALPAAFEAAVLDYQGGLDFPAF
jgi:acyl-CoA thioester hydrolase